MRLPALRAIAVDGSSLLRPLEQKADRVWAQRQNKPLDLTPDFDCADQALDLRAAVSSGIAVGYQVIIRLLPHYVAGISRCLN